MDCRGDVCKIKGLPCAEHNWSHPTPTYLPQNTAEYMSKDGCASVKRYLRKAKKKKKKTKHWKERREQKRE